MTREVNVTETIDTVERRRGTRCCAGELEPRLDPAAASQLSADLQILAHPVRLQILDLLLQHAGKVCVCDLEAALPVKQPTVSHHLRLLRAAGLIDSERQGPWAYYFVQHDALRQVQARIAQGMALLSS
jgi:ArsR family transcriptional regulator